jgi:hypothetical protein
MNVQQTTGTSAELAIRELTATELDHVSGGHMGGGEWLVNFIFDCYLLAVTSNYW